MTLHLHPGTSLMAHGVMSTVKIAGGKGMSGIIWNMIVRGVGRGVTGGGAV